jgi:membrane protein DedA with SNARE-associated domain
MSIDPVLTAYGYPILYLGTIFEGETFVIISAVLCQTGHLDVIWVVCTAFLGALSGDLICFRIGRIGSGKYLKKGFRWQRRADKAGRLLKRYGNAVVFFYRFFYGLRAVIPFLIGVTDYSFWRFILLSSAGAFVWSITITAAGLVFGKALLPFITDMEYYLLLFIGGLGVIGLLVWAICRFEFNNRSAAANKRRN